MLCGSSLGPGGFLCFVCLGVCVVCVKKFVFRDSRTWVLGLGFGFGVLGVLGFLVFGVGGFPEFFPEKTWPIGHKK